MLRPLTPRMLACKFVCSCEVDKENFFLRCILRVLPTPNFIRQASEYLAPLVGGSSPASGYNISPLSMMALFLVSSEEQSLLISVNLVALELDGFGKVQDWLLNFMYDL